MTDILESNNPLSTASSTEKTSSRTKAKNPAFVIMCRELKSYFSSPIAYIVTGLFTLASGFLFFNTFFLNSKETIKFVTNGANVDKKPSKAIHCTTNVHNSKFSE